MKKVYLIWILPQAAKKRDGQVSICKTDEKKHLEKLESYDKREQIVIYLDKEHDTSKKYQEYDEILTPLVVFLNNILDYQGKIRIMKEYGFKVIDKEVEKMCNLGEMIEREAKQKERRVMNLEHLQNVMHELQCSMQRAMDILKLTDDEREEIRKYFQA